MKNLFLILLISISTASNAQSSRERMNDIEWEQKKQRVEKEGREFDRQMDELRRLREKNRDSPYMVLPDGTVINVDEHIRNQKNICYLTWTGNQFIRDNKINENYTEVQITEVPPLKLFFQNKSNVEIEKILQNSSNQKQMIKLCPILKNYQNILIH